MQAIYTHCCLDCAFKFNVRVQSLTFEARQGRGTCSAWLASCNSQTGMTSQAMMYLLVGGGGGALEFLSESSLNGPKRHSESAWKCRKP